MYKKSRNIYQIARESVGITQEKAAELIDISVESMRVYEGSKRIPPDWVVIKMIDLYNAPYLALQHMRNSGEVGKKVISEVIFYDLPTAMLKLQKEITDLINVKDEMIAITCDGQISESERTRWQIILNELNDVQSAILSVKFARKE